MNALLPTFALFTRALREYSRGRLSYILRATALSFVLLLIWINESDFANKTAPGLELLALITIVNFVGLTLIALGTFPSAITEEKEDDNLALMRMTELGPLSILLGKSSVRLISALLFLFAQLPFTILCVALGGTSVGQIVRTYCILAVYMVFLCNLSLLFSVLARQTRKATSYVFGIGCLLYIAAPMLFHGMTSRANSTGSSWYEHALGFLSEANPVSQLVQTLASSWLGPTSRTEVFIFHLVAGGVCFGLAWLAFDRFCGPDAGATRTIRKSARTGNRRHSRPWRTAIIWKDFRFLTGGARGLIIRTALYTLLIVVIAAFVVYAQNDGNRPKPLSDQIRSALDQQTLGRIFTYTAWTMFTLEVGLAASRVFGAERRQNTLSTLLIIPITTRRLVFQKAVGCIMGLIPSFGLWAFGMTLLLTVPQADRDKFYMQTHYGYMAASYALTAAAYTCFAVLIAYLSLRMRRGALLTGLLAALGWYVITTLISYLITVNRMRAWSSSGNSFDDYFTYLTVVAVAQASILGCIALFICLKIPGRLAMTAAAE